MSRELCTPLYGLLPARDLRSGEDMIRILEARGQLSVVAVDGERTAELRRVEMRGLESGRDRGRRAEADDLRGMTLDLNANDQLSGHYFSLRLVLFNVIVRHIRAESHLVRQTLKTGFQSPFQSGNARGLVPYQ